MNAKLSQRAGWVLSGLAIAFLSFDGAIKLVPIAAVLESLAQLGYPLSAARGIGMLELACLALYAFPRSAVLGAILLTGFLGGAIASHARIESPLFSHTLFSTYLGVFVWGGLYLRDERLRALVPLRRRTVAGS
ncbi:MAG TPA: DoxX family protein [Myxococcota bacterium]|nr:DoxX family protein [Myxococcota bacterium]